MASGVVRSSFSHWRTPYIIGFARLRIIGVEDAHALFDGVPDEEFALRKYSFRLDKMCFSFTGMVDHIPAGKPMDVLLGCVYQRGGFITSDEERVPIAELRELIPTVPVTTAADPEVAGADVEEGLPDWVEFPWLLDDMPFDEVALTAQEKKKRKTAEATGEDVADKDIAEADMDIAAMLDTLYAERARWHGDAADEGPSSDFKVFLRGETAHDINGRFTQCWRAQSDRGEPSNFAEVYHLGRTSDYHVNTYGDETAHAMAQAWCHKLQHFYDAWIASDCPADMDWAPIIAGYREPDSLSGLEARAPRVTAMRLGKLRKLRPHN